MCGIAGVFGEWSRPTAERATAAMIVSIAHRGPDGRGAMSLSVPPGMSLALAHARLSILDLSEAAAQPMQHAETGSWLIYNGELYNHRELRRELEALGHTFRSTGDTEVLLCALVQWGTPALRRLNGMYAFAFWHGVERRLLLARDALGIKPLYFTRTSKGLLFASEVRGLRASGLIDPRLSSRGLKAFLTYGAVVEPETINESVLAVPPGQVIEMSGTAGVKAPQDAQSLERLLCIDRAPSTAGDYETAVDRTRTMLRDAVERHLISDVRLGILLSGGIDSSLLAGMATQTDHQQLELLTVGFEEQQFSEVASAQAIAAKLQATHTTVVLSPKELADMVPAALAAMDQPTVDGINTFVVSSIAARAGIRVLLSGLGGDEVFGGYTTFRRVPMLTRFGGWFARLGPALAAVDRSREVQWSKLGHAGRVSVLRDAYLLQRAIHWGNGRDARPSLPGPPEEHQMPPETWEQLARVAALDDFHQIAFFEMSFYMRNQLLRDADVFSSAVAVEMRVPYLDRELVRTAWSIAGRHHVSLISSKNILRTLAKEMFPTLPMSRRKMGFTFPWSDWLRGPLSALVGDVLNSPAAYSAVGLEASVGRQMLDEFLQKRRAVSWYQVWSLFVLLQWQSQRRLAA